MITVITFPYNIKMKSDRWHSIWSSLITFLLKIPHFDIFPRKFSIIKCFSPQNSLAYCNFPKVNRVAAEIVRSEIVLPLRT